MKQQSYTVLSVRQPWAWLIVTGYKNIENRTWDTRYRGRIAIHAAARFAWDFLEDNDEVTRPLKDYKEIVREYFGIPRNRRKITRHTDEFRAIVGTVELVDCHNTALAPLHDSNPWSFDCGFAWMLKSPEQWEQPIRNVPGRLFLWKYVANGNKRNK